MWVISVYDLMLNLDELGRKKENSMMDSYFSAVSHDQNNWLDPVKPFRRSSLMLHK